MAKLDRSEENALLAALGHPLRRRILRRMRDVDSISPLQLSRDLGHPIANVAYHVRVLVACDAVALVRTRQVRGAVEHFYRSTVEPQWARQIIDLEPGGDPPPGESPAPPRT